MVLHRLSQLPVPLELELANQPALELEREQEELEELELEWVEQVWVEQVWVAVLIPSLVWAVWEVWEECQCSQVWLQVVDPLVWVEWVEQIWIHKW